MPTVIRVGEEANRPLLRTRRVGRRLRRYIIARPLSPSFPLRRRLLSITTYEASDYMGGGDTRVLRKRRSPMIPR